MFAGLSSCCAWIAGDYASEQRGEWIYWAATDGFRWLGLWMEDYMGINVVRLIAVNKLGRCGVEEDKVKGMDMRTLDE